MGLDFESVAVCWLSDKKFRLLNVFSSAILWSLWKTRNDLYFQNMQWTGFGALAGRCARMLRDWGAGRVDKRNGAKKFKAGEAYRKSTLAVAASF